VIETADQSRLRDWLCERIGYVPSPHMYCIGNVSNGKILGVVGYDGWNGASVQMHSAGEGNWLTRTFLKFVFWYPFEQEGMKIVIGSVPSGNTLAIKFNLHVGFKVEYVIEDAHPDGALVVMTMRRGECRFLQRNRYG